MLRTALSAVIVVVGFADVVRADCASAPPAPAWTFPADGDGDVPIDARIFTFGNVPVVFDGEALTTTSLADVTVADPGALAPNTEHEVTFGEGSPTLHFRTGTRTAAVVVAPDVKGVEVVGARALSPLCRAVVNNGECFDTGQSTDVKVVVDDRPLGFLVTPRARDSEFPSGGTHFWPAAECGDPGVFVDGGSDICIDVASVGEDGSVSDVVNACGCGGCSGGGGSVVGVVVVGLLFRRRANQPR